MRYVTISIRVSVLRTPDGGRVALEGNKMAIIKLGRSLRRCMRTHLWSNGAAFPLKTLFCRINRWHISNT
jgi:hypothetical protein